LAGDALPKRVVEGLRHPIRQGHLGCSAADCRAILGAHRRVRYTVPGTRTRDAIMIRASAAFLLLLLAGCTAASAPAPNAAPELARFNGSYAVVLSLGSVPFTSIGMCDSRIEHPLTVTNGVISMPWNTVRAINLVGTITPDGALSAAASYEGLNAAMTGKLDLDHHSLTGTLNSHGCIYALSLAG
jgi:hypothetical protein